MDISNLLQTLAILIEVAIAAVAVLIAVQNKKVYGWFIALTFVLFVLFDIGRVFMVEISGDVHSLIFLAACASMLYAVWLIWKET
jgi:hypothetical protein